MNSELVDRQNKTSFEDNNKTHNGPHTSRVLQMYTAINTTRSPAGLRGLLKVPFYSGFVLTVWFLNSIHIKYKKNLFSVWK